MDSHFVSIPGLGTLTVGGLSSGDGQNLSGESDRALDSQFRSLGSVDQVGADLLKLLDLGRSEGDSNLQDVLLLRHDVLFLASETHVVGGDRVKVVGERTCQPPQS